LVSTVHSEVSFGRAAHQTRRTTRVGLLAAVGIALFVLESFIPLPFPFLKIGLANISTVLALDLLGFPEGVLVTSIRVIVGSTIVGSLFSPGFVLALGGGLASVAVMGAARRMTGEMFSLVGISLMGSVTHVMTQWFLVLILFVQNAALGMLLPLLLLSALFGGLVVGWIAVKVVAVLGPYIAVIARP
jgi:heptaprenyl diphosphate synthase